LPTLHSIPPAPDTYPPWASDHGTSAEVQCYQQLTTMYMNNKSPSRDDSASPMLTYPGERARGPRSGNHRKLRIQDLATLILSHPIMTQAVRETATKKMMSPTVPSMPGTSASFNNIVMSLAGHKGQMLAGLYLCGKGSALTRSCVGLCVLSDTAGGFGSLHLIYARKVRRPKCCLLLLGLTALSVSR